MFVRKKKKRVSVIAFYFFPSRSEVSVTSVCECVRERGVGGWALCIIRLSQSTHEDKTLISLNELHPLPQDTIPPPPSMLLNTASPPHPLSHHAPYYNPRSTMLFIPPPPPPAMFLLPHQPPYTGSPSIFLILLELITFPYCFNHK